jgi:hypothetical protein
MVVADFGYYRSFHGGVFKNNKFKKKKKKTALHLSVSLSWFKETGDFTMSKGHGYPLVYIMI